MLIGRKKEKSILLDNYNLSESSFIAIYGRRRVGKTYLVRNVFNNKFCFSHAGIYNGSYKQQLDAFTNSLQDYGLTNFNRPNNWIEAFQLLKKLIIDNKNNKKVIFLDELSWMDTPKSDLLKALENFYNGWADGRKDVMLIICSSVTSWIINKIIHSKGGLYNRITKQLFIKPFTLKECEEYSISNNLALTRKQIIDIYMIIGGIPYYWKYYKKGNSTSQFIDNCFFGDNAELANEFDYILSSLFRYPVDYIKILNALSKKQIGLTRQEILKETNIKDSGNFSNKLEDLVSCGFINGYLSYKSKLKEKRYQLIDPFTIFHYHFLTKRTNDKDYWKNQINNPIINSWQGLAFERLCFYHQDCIKRALGISGVNTSIYPWMCKKDLDNGIYGSQIDMVIERKDEIINLVEIKYSSSPYLISSKYMDDIYRKKDDFIKFTNTKSSIHLTFITINDLEHNSYYNEIQSVINVDDLFSE